MAKRKSFSKKERFEVFKRDSFTCQYCGAKAPDVILEVDHIKPVSEGGDNDIMNLITSCFTCNRGKRNTELSDNSVIEKQRRQIEELNLRRQQLEMMLEWRDGLKAIEDEKHQKAVEYWNSKLDVYDMALTNTGESNMKRLVEKYGLMNVLDAIDIACDKYLKDEKTASTAFGKIGGILHLQNAPEHKKKIAYIKGICRNKFGYFNEKRASILLNNFYEGDGNLDELEAHIKSHVRNWTGFVNLLTR